MNPLPFIFRPDLEIVGLLVYVKESDLKLLLRSLSPIGGDRLNRKLLAGTSGISSGQMLHSVSTVSFFSLSLMFFS